MASVAARVRPGRPPFAERGGAQLCRKAPLRIALFVDGLTQPRWLADAVGRIAVSDFARIVLIAVSPTSRGEPPWWWRAGEVVDRWMFGIKSDPCAPVDLPSMLPGCDVINVPRTPFVRADWRRKVREARPDVAFVLGDLNPAHFDHLARYGVWSYCFGPDLNVGEPWAGWHEVAAAVPITRSGLRVRLPDGGQRILFQSSSRTCPFSLARNRTNLLNKTAQFAERELRLLHRFGAARLQAAKELPVSEAGPEPEPGKGELIRSISRVGTRIAGRALEKLTTIDQWFIAYRFGQGHDADLRGFIRLMPPRDRIWADPFPLVRDGRNYIFFEEVLFADNKGHISVIEVAPDGSHSEPVKVLERDYHLSYPFLIEQGDELFMVPESGANRTVELYRCERFPDVWRLEKVLLAGIACADATFHYDGKRWWMFVNVGAEGTELYDELHIYYADDLLGEWHPHVANPVKSDVRSARPAGKLFTRDGQLLRPAQICTPLYGSGICIARIGELTTTAYREEEVEQILPGESSGILGIHTLNRHGRLLVVDGFARRSRL